eukprot:CAMPEP_0170587776 /NCGR_PEP_ID=MMETSP0224-20130122/10465_1 /TAXON_ID=285029 /ORGANISM="Togula jolla, Strain CCCM 725" /LENGTH=100 /DNA_ID=CAMNT_0010911425 /DNA_START=360 /DNA_END=661 /DNA_ORIENTATION=-
MTSPMCLSPASTAGTTGSFPFGVSVRVSMLRPISCSEVMSTILSSGGRLQYPRAQGDEACGDRPAQDRARHDAVTCVMAYDGHDVRVLQLLDGSEMIPVL